VVAAKHILAAHAGAEMLERGGNAVDAAVATAFTAGVVEPWMSGLGGGGYMVIQPASDQPPWVVDYAVVSPRAAREDMWEIVEGRSTGLFPWPMVKDDANHQGWRSVAVPGVAAGLGLALERFGTLDLPTVLAPAIHAAANGFPVSWHATLRIAVEAPILAAYPETARTFLPNGYPLVAPSSNELPPILIVQPGLADTLERLAHQGVADLYQGETARRLVAASRAGGGLLSEEDLASYRASVVPALTVGYRGWRVGASGGPAGGVTLARVLETFAPTGRFGSADYLFEFVMATRAAFEDRYAYLGDVAEPVGTSTTHLATTDEDGMVVSCTQTLLSAFGSRVTAGGTGILLNNGMYWFDPRPERANSASPSKKPLANMAPLVAMGPGGWPRLGLGSSGGRRIISANIQMLLATVDGGLSLAEALSAPRIDASGPRILADNRLAADVLEDLAARGLDVVAVEESPYPRHFGSPAGVAAYADGRRIGAADVFMPSGVVAL
jgi:gamma-glutamyltranspeptidase / glutathione hydrolase